MAYETREADDKTRGGPRVHNRQDEVNGKRFADQPRLSTRRSRKGKDHSEWIADRMGEMARRASSRSIRESNERQDS